MGRYDMPNKAAAFALNTGSLESQCHWYKLHSKTAWTSIPLTAKGQYLQRYEVTTDIKPFPINISQNLNYIPPMYLSIINTIYAKIRPRTGVPYQIVDLLSF